MPVYRRLISSKREPSPDRQDSAEPVLLAPGQPLSCRHVIDWCSYIEGYTHDCSLTIYSEQVANM